MFHYFLQVIANIYILWLYFQNGYREIKIKKIKCLEWKNVKPWVDQLNRLKEMNISSVDISLKNSVCIGKAEELNEEEHAVLLETAKTLIPWRKGPFNLFGLEINSEWQSNIKYDLIRPFFDLKDKVVADIGCNNGYYMFRMLEDKPKKIIGFDPAPLPMLQFEFINHFYKSDIEYEMLGVEHLEAYNHKFDFIFMLGVLYHRPDPVGTLKSLNRGLNKGGEILIDTFMIDSEEEVSLTPHDRYSKIPNIYFIPSIKALKNWLNRAGFGEIEVLATTITSNEEQRKTSWSFDQSLEDFFGPQ